MTDLRLKEIEFIKKYKEIDVNDLNVSDYVKNYIKSYQEEIESVVQRYIFILKEVVRKKGKFISIIDFGGGTGILSLLAKFIGIKHVYYLDISEEMKNGAESLSNKLGIKIDRFLVWDYSQNEKLPLENIDAILNYDVLEHLYKPFEVFNILKDYLAEDGMILMASGSNTYNPIIRILFSKKHLISEFYGTGNGKEIDSKDPFYKIRKKIIQQHFPYLDDEKFAKFAKFTRGLRKEDIISAVELHLEKNKIFILPYLNNTCDPITGNWDENLIEYFDLRDRLKDLFNFVTVKNGFYPEVKANFKKAPQIKDDNIVKKMYPYLKYVSEIIGKPINLLMKILPSPTTFLFAPFYYIVAENPKKKSCYHNDVKEIYDNWAVWKDIPKIDLDAHYTPSQSLKKLIKFFDENEYSTEKILDAGCGNGSIASYLQSKNYNLHTCDISAKSQKFIKNFSQASIDNLPYKDNSFDLIYSFSVIHHLDNPQNAIIELKRVLKPNGILITSQHTK